MNLEVVSFYFYLEGLEFFCCVSPKFGDDVSKSGQLVLGGDRDLLPISAIKQHYVLSVLRKFVRFVGQLRQAY